MDHTIDLGKRRWIRITSHRSEALSVDYYKASSHDYRNNFEATLSISTCRRGPALKMHIGDRGSDTPLDFIIGLWLVTFYLSFGSDRLRRFCTWLGRGHKRNLSLQVHNGSLWWELWYDGQCGYDQHHRCDKWRRPKLWPWSRGRAKYRSWMCLREGSIDLNPLDAIWGHRKYSYRDITEYRNPRLVVGEWDEDVYDVTFKLQRGTWAREHGPSWARGEVDKGYSVRWSSPKGIPFRNHDWKGDNALSGGLPIHDHSNWIEEAERGLRQKIRRERVRFNYRAFNDAMKSASTGMREMGDTIKSTMMMIKSLPESKPTSHFTILPDGEIVQNLPLSDRPSNADLGPLTAENVDYILKYLEP